MNGHTHDRSDRYIYSIDPDDPEREREMMRSVEVREDVIGMEARKRVSQILSSQTFREDLEQMVESQLSLGPHPSSLISLHQISQLLLPKTSTVHANLSSAVQGPIIPIADIRGINAAVYTKGERLLRCKMAAVFRLIDLKGWTDGIYDHISVRVVHDKEHFLFNPIGLLNHEITAGSLVKVDMQGHIVDRGNTVLDIDAESFKLHAAIHAARPDVRCVLYTTVSSAIVVSSLKQGLMGLTHDALMLGDVSYHDYSVYPLSDSDLLAMARSIGPSNKVLFLRNQGLVVCGASVEETWSLLALAIRACEQQVKLLSCGSEGLKVPSDEIKKKTRANRKSAAATAAGKNWREGELEFESWMRFLDQAGYKTGYVYRVSALRCERTDRLSSDIEYPPVTSLLTYYDDQNNPSSLIKGAQEQRRRLHKTGWLSTPNVYKREEIEEIGTHTPKKITKWVQDNSAPERTPPVKLATPNQFVPVGTDKKELRQHQRQIKSSYYKDVVSSGPSSKVLDGNYTEAEPLDASQSATGDHIRIVGAASKGIIRREHQHNAIVYRSQYANNPFDKMTDEELRQYEETVRHADRLPTEAVQVDGPHTGDEMSTPNMQNAKLSVDVNGDVETNIDGDLPVISQSTTALYSSPPPRQLPMQSPVGPESQSGIEQVQTTPVSPAFSVSHEYSPRQGMKPARSRETNIDNLEEELPKTRPDHKPPKPPVRRGSDEFSSMVTGRSPQAEGDQAGNFQRSKSERKPKKVERNSNQQAIDASVTLSIRPPTTTSEDSFDGVKDKKKDKKSLFSFTKKKDSKKAKHQTDV